ncbi:MAG: shikimate kinase [Desulfosalsimonadaceae bacterium]|nr:shikimate kinase [Desulfosalsimonadaceae bacterium]
MNIVLIGYRGTGKSEVGKILAGRLKMTCIGMDAEIENRAGMSIPEIVTKHGWPGFRDMESAVVRDLSGQDRLIVDTGGGVIERIENIEFLKKNAVIFWLRASVPVIVARISASTDRPALIQGKTFTEEVAEVLDRRTPLYRSAAHHEIDTDPLTPAVVAEQILKYLTDRCAFQPKKR